MKKNNTKINVTNCPEAFDYVVYMIVGSYFAKATCNRSKFQERKLFLHYKEEKLKSQLAMEDACISFVEQNLLTGIPAEFWNSEVEVRICKRNERQSFICFDGKNFSLVCHVELPKNHKAVFHAELFVNDKTQETVL